MSTINFTPPPPPGFGGGISGFQHFFSQHGQLELSPHNVVHVMIGGLMADPNSAALDPIFWLHHANIDRIWVEWTADASHADPTDTAWRNQSFDLFDESGAAVSMTVAGALDTEAQLNYRYDTAGVPPAIPWPGRYLRFPPMTRGEDVKQWQQQMVTRGFSLAVDGLYGPLSRAACRQFQQQNGLVVDGIVGPITWGAVFANP